MAAPTLSVCLIVRDEAENLSGLFASLQALRAFQIVVVDTGSKDGTPDLVRSRGAEVHAFHWTDDFAAARNHALSLCTGDFVLWLDADDRLPEATARKLPELLKQAVAWRLLVRSPREDGTGDVFRQIRLFPNHRNIAFEGRIHEQVGSACRRLGIPLRDSELEILHTGYASPDLRKSKALRNLTLLRRESGEHPEDPAVAMAMGNALCQCGHFDEAKRIFIAWMEKTGIDSIPENPVLRRFPCFLSECCAHLSEKIEAEDWDFLAMEWEPAHFLPKFRQAKRELENGRVAEAIRFFLAIAESPVVTGILASDNGSVRRNALGYAALLETKMKGAVHAENAKQCLLTLMKEGLDPLPVDPLFPFEFFRDRDEAENLKAYVEARLAAHPEDKELEKAYRSFVEPSPPAPLPPARERGDKIPLHRRFGTIEAPLKLPYKSGTLSIAMIVKNEAKNIREAIDSFRPIADEIVVHDTGSTDGTQDILRELGVTWFQGEWENDFSMARNRAVDRCRSSWVLWMDADDRIPEDQYKNFRKLKTAPLDRVFGFQVINTQGGKPLGGRFMQVRMFPNHPDLRFRFRVHEQIVHAAAEMGLHCFNTDTTIHHTGYEDADLKKQKARRNLEMLAGERERMQSEPALAMSVGDSHFILGEWEPGIAAYRRALEIPGCEEIHPEVFAELPACIGLGLKHLGRHAEAMEWFAKSRALRPDKTEPAFHEAECLLALGRPREAEEAFGRVAAMPLTFTATANQYDTVRIFSLWNQARLQASRGAENEAAATLEKLLRTYPEVVEAWHMLGNLEWKRGRRKEAATAFTQAVNLNPGALDALHRDRLKLLKEMGREEEYEDARKLAGKHFPGFTPPPWIKNSVSSPLPSGGEREKTPSFASGGGVNEGKHSAPLLSLCMIVKNEMGNLPACLDSVGDLADEIVVVDTGSADGTDAWAERRGVKLLRTEWKNDFSLARNLSLERATGRWILWLDADDRLLPGDKAAIRSLVESAPETKAYGLLVKNSGDGGKTGTVFNQIRIIPNRPALRFESPIHEQILPAIERAGLTVDYLPIRILHTGYADPAVAKSKQVRNRAMLETQIRENRGATAVTHYTLGMACLDLGDYEAALQNFSRAEKTAREVGSNPHIAAAAPVKSAVALAQSKKNGAALDLLARASKETRALPEATLVQAQLLATMGRVEEAREKFEQLLNFKEGSSFTPMDFQMLKIHALKFLGTYWHRLGRKNLAVHLLRSALKVGSGGDFSSEDLQKAYALPADPEPREVPATV